MATGFPVKANYATGDVLTAANMNDLSGTVNLIAPSAKGDLFAGSAANTYTKLAVGTNGQVLTADSTAATGLKWASASSTPTFVGCSVNYNADYSVSNTTTTVVPWNGENFDTNSFHDNTTNNSRITIPSGYGGKYLVFFYFKYNSNGTGYRAGNIRLNGSTILQQFRAAGQSGSMTYVGESSVWNLSAGDYIEITAYQDSGGSINILGGTNECCFGVVYLGA